MASARQALLAEDVGKSFGSQEVLRSASLRADAGTVTGLMGRNGSGKTTLLRIAAGALPADGGRIVLRERPVPSPSLASLARRGLMYLPQEQLIAGRYRVRDHLRVFATTFGSDGMGELVEAMRLSQLLDVRAALLSRGERVRLSLTLALLRRPAVLLADEPLVGLAPKDQEEAAAALRRLAATGAAVVASGHDARALLESADAIVWVVDGTTHALGAPARARTHERFVKEYLGPGFDGSNIDS